MKIIVPIPNDYKINVLQKMGIDEFYFGFVPTFWKEKYSLHASVNRRYAETEQHYEEKKLLNLIQQYNRAKFYAAFNASLYNTDQIDKLMKVLKRFYGYGLKGVILSDLGLLNEARRQMPKMEIHLSCLAACMNQYGVEFFKGLGVNRVILPRSTALDEIQELKRMFPGVIFEVLIRTKDCPNIDGLCTHHHFGNVQQMCSLENRYFKDQPGIPESENIFSRLESLIDAGADVLKFPRRGESQKDFVIQNIQYFNFINQRCS